MKRTTSNKERFAIKGSWGVQRIAAAVVGVFFTTIAVSGYLAGPTPLGFGTNFVLSTVHLVLGVAALSAAWYDAARGFNRIAGIIMVFLAVLGWVARDLMASLLNYNTPDAVVHLLLGLALIALGLGGAGIVRRRTKA